MPPPELAANTPVLDVLHPMVVDLSPTLRMKAHLVGARLLGNRQQHRVMLAIACSRGAPFNGCTLRSFIACLLHAATRLLQARIAQEPLLAKAWFDGHLGPLTKSNFIIVGL